MHQQRQIIQANQGVVACTCTPSESSGTTAFMVDNTHETFQLQILEVLCMHMSVLLSAAFLTNRND